MVPEPSRWRATARKEAALGRDGNMTSRDTIPVNMHFISPQRQASPPTCGCTKSPARSLEAQKVEIHHGEGARCTEVADYSKSPDLDFG